MNNEEIKHHKWTHQEIGPGFINRVKKWEFLIEITMAATKITFQHYGLNKEKNSFKPIINNPGGSDLDKLFAGATSEIIFYGHQHEPSDIQGKCRYVNLGSAGCHDKPEVRIGILEILDGRLNLEKISAVYEDDGLMAEFENKNVPAREFITNTFIIRK